MCRLLKLVCLYCLMLLSSLQADWTFPPEDISSGGTASDPQIVVDGSGNATAVWRQYEESNYVIQSSTKPFGGSWVLSSEPLSLISRRAYTPQIAVDSSGNVTAVWSRQEGSYDFIQSSTKPFGEGKIWSSPKTLSLTGGSATTPQIAVDGSGNATAVWSRLAESSGDRFYVIQSSTKPFGEGEIWSSPETLSLVGGSAYDPQIVVDGSGNVTAVWSRQNGSYYFIQSSTKPFGEGEIWSSPETLSLTGGNASSPQIAVDSSGNATAVWSRKNGSYYFIQSSTKPFGKGEIWTPPETFSLVGGSAYAPQIAVDGSGNATAVWYRNDGSYNFIQSSTKPFGGGEIWSPPEPLSLTGGHSLYPQIAVDGSGNATAVWYRDDGSYYVIQSSIKLFGEGTSWSPPEDLSSTGEYANAPQIAVDGSGSATAVWHRNDVIQSSSNTIVSVPTVTSVSPNFGPISGGNTVIITGTNFIDVTAVTFGETSALSFTPVSETSLMAVAPTGFFGTMEHVTVTSFSKTSAQTASDQYTYEIQPPLSSQKFVGKIHSRTHKYRYSLHTRWNLSPSPYVVRYEIYVPGHHCIASIDATLKPKKNINFFAHFLKTHAITDRFLHKIQKKYKIRAVDVYGQKSHFTHVEAKK